MKKSKDWWSELVFFTREDGRLDKSQLDYLEANLIKDFINSGFNMDNGNGGNYSYIEPYNKGKAISTLSKGLELLEDTANLNIFKKVRESKKSKTFNKIDKDNNIVKELQETLENSNIIEIDLNNTPQKNLSIDSEDSFNAYKKNIENYNNNENVEKPLNKYRKVNKTKKLIFTITDDSGLELTGKSLVKLYTDYIKSLYTNNRYKNKIIELAANDNSALCDSLTIQNKREEFYLKVNEDFYILKNLSRNSIKKNLEYITSELGVDYILLEEDEISVP